MAWKILLVALLPPAFCLRFPCISLLLCMNIAPASTANSLVNCRSYKSMSADSNSPSPRLLLLTRHGERQDFVTPWTPKADWHEHDPPLSARGFQQAKELGAHIRQSGIRVDRILVSPFLRTMQTALEIVRALDEQDDAKTAVPPICLEFGVSEWHTFWSPHKLPRHTPRGLLQQMLKEEALVERHLSRYFDISFSSTYPDFMSKLAESKGGESLAQMKERAKDAMARILERFPNEQLLLVGHAASKIALARAAIGDDSYPLRAGVCSLTMLALRPASASIASAGGSENSDAASSSSSASDSASAGERKNAAPSASAESKRFEVTVEVVKNGDSSFLSQGEAHVWILPGDEHIYGKLENMQTFSQPQTSDTAAAADVDAADSTAAPTPAKEAVKSDPVVDSAAANTATADAGSATASAVVKL